MVIVITSDVDFVSDDVLMEAYKGLEKIPMTIFQTHHSKYLEKSFKENNWEAEIHPNFCEGSTQGKTVAEVISFMSSIPSRNIGYRCHRYYTVNEIEEYYVEAGFKYISNVCTDLELIHPFVMRSGLVQYPIFMEDGGYLKYHGVPKATDIIKKMQEEGIYVFNFHPIHLALNSKDFYYVRKIKDSLSIAEYNNIDLKNITRLRNNGYGIRTFLNELLEYAQKNNIEIKTLEECFYERKDNCF